MATTSDSVSAHGVAKCCKNLGVVRRLARCECLAHEFFRAAHYGPVYPEISRIPEIPCSATGLKMFSLDFLWDNVSIEEVSSWVWRGAGPAFLPRRFYAAAASIGRLDAVRQAGHAFSQRLPIGWFVGPWRWRSRHTVCPGLQAAGFCGAQRPVCQPSHYRHPSFAPAWLSCDS